MDIGAHSRGATPTSSNQRACDAHPAPPACWHAARRSGMVPPLVGGEPHEPIDVGEGRERIPRVSKEEWDGLDIISRWLIATRSAVLVMTFISAAIAGLLAARTGSFTWCCGAGHRRAALRARHEQPGQRLHRPLQGRGQGQLLSGTVTDRRPARARPDDAEPGVALHRRHRVDRTSAGIVLVAMRGQVNSPCLHRRVFVLFYTWPLKYIGLGEVAVILVWGPLMVGGGLLRDHGADLDAGNPRQPARRAGSGRRYCSASTSNKLDADAAKGIRTMPVLLASGMPATRTIAHVHAQYVLAAAVVVSGYCSRCCWRCCLRWRGTCAGRASTCSPAPGRRPSIRRTSGRCGTRRSRSAHAAVSAVCFCSGSPPTCWHGRRAALAVGAAVRPQRPRHRCRTASARHLRGTSAVTSSAASAAARE